MKPTWKLIIVAPSLASLLVACAVAAPTGTREGAVYAASDWHDIYRLFAQLDGNTDGVVAGAFVDKISMLLDEHWDQLSDLNALLSKDASFGPFLYRHLGESVPADRYKRIRQHAKADCKPELTSLCREVLRWTTLE